jgi:hypothetical protein
MDQEDVKGLFDDKYQRLLGMSYRDWLTQGPQNETEAYRRCNEIDAELNRTYEEWYEAEGVLKEQLQDYRDKLKAEYDLIEEVFHLDLEDRSW